MTYSNETIQQFIELRSIGRSLSDISEELKVPRSTLGDWNKRHFPQIELAAAANWETCEARSPLHFPRDLAWLGHLIVRCQTELDRRSLQRMSNADLLRLLFGARRAYFKRRDPLLAPLERGDRARSPQRAAASPPRENELNGHHTRQNFDPSNQPDKSGQKPDASRNGLNGNHLRDPIFEPDNSRPSALHNSTITEGGRDGAPSPSVSCGSAVDAPESKTETPKSQIEVNPCDRPKKHKPYWINGYYYPNPEFPEHVARAMVANPARNRKPA
jgi:hypothetical protein